MFTGQGDSLSVVICSQSDCRNVARARPYSEGYLCRQCHRKIQDAAAPPTQSQPGPKSGDQQARQRAQQKKDQTAKTRALWLEKKAAAQAAQRHRPRIVQAKPEIKGKALKPPGPLADLPPMWWEFNG
ncbi:hypothetical protein SHIRM173S_13167 [Streptomyces hirsutus]